MAATKKAQARGGRPPKFQEECRPITVTLPVRILNELNRVNPDRALALVSCVEAAIGGRDHERRAVELIEVLPGKCLIVVNACHALSRIEGLRLVEIAPCRFLLMLPMGMPIERLEVEMRDMMEELDGMAEAELDLLKQLQALVSNQRRKETITKGELLLVDTGS